MRKIFGVCLLGLVTFCIMSFEQGHLKVKEIYWSGSRLLTWEDFQNRSKGQGDEAAVSSVSIESNYDTKLAEMRVISSFNPNESWVWNKQKSETLLKHEQGHFDITEIFSRMFRKRVIATSFTKNNIKEKYTKIHNEITADWVKEQSTYDKETNHGVDSIKQNEWYKKIITDLEKYKEYANDTLIHLKL